MSSDEARAGEFAELFRAVYLTFHRRDGPRSQLPNASLAVVSEIVSHLERQGMLERESDPADRRRTLIWLTAAGRDTLRRQREVLSTDLLAGALSRLPADQVTGLLGALRALVHSAGPGAPGPSQGEST